MHATTRSVSAEELYTLSLRESNGEWQTRDGGSKKEDADASLAHVQQAAALRSRLQSVRQLKQSLLIVNDVKVVHAGSHVRAVALHNFTSWESRGGKKSGNADYQAYWVFNLNCSY